MMKLLSEGVRASLLRPNQGIEYRLFRYLMCVTIKEKRSCAHLASESEKKRVQGFVLMEADCCRDVFVQLISKVRTLDK